MPILILIKWEFTVAWVLFAAPIPLGIWWTVRGILAWQRTRLLAKTAAYASGTVVGTSNYGSVVTIRFEDRPGQFTQFTQHLYFPMRYFPRRNQIGSWAPVSYDPHNPALARVGPPEAIAGWLENGIPVLAGLIVLVSGLGLLHLIWSTLFSLVR